MKILLALFFFYSFLAPGTFANDDDDYDNGDKSDLIVSNSSNFASQTTNFSSGQTIYVKVSANSEGSSKRELNLRDNKYSLLQTHTLEYLGNNQFKGSIPAPTTSGYYSLEARIESTGSVTTAVKTIKVGSANNSSVTVDVDVSANGQVLSSKSTPTPKPVSPTPALAPDTSSQEPQPSPTLPGASIDFEDKKGFFESIREFIEKLFNSIF